MPLVNINHVGIVVEDMNVALDFWQKTLGLKVHRTERNDKEDVDVVFLPVGDSEIELISPTNDDGGIARYMAKKGAGMHHLCVEVDDIDATMQRLMERGVELINGAPLSRADGTRYAFVHPRSTGGVLLEMYQLAG